MSRISTPPFLLEYLSYTITLYKGPNLFVCFFFPGVVVALSVLGNLAACFRVRSYCEVLVVCFLKQGSLRRKQLKGQDDSFKRRGNHLEQREKLGVAPAPKGRSNPQKSASEPQMHYITDDIRICM